MTAFDNIKTNNWPSESNDFEDFLVLELPLNDDASLHLLGVTLLLAAKCCIPSER